MYGRDGWMFYRNDDMVLQSAGLVRRDERVVATADLLAAMKNELSASGIKLLVALPRIPLQFIRTNSPVGRGTMANERNTICYSMNSLPERWLPWICGRPCAMRDLEAEFITGMTRIGQIAGR